MNIIIQKSNNERSKNQRIILAVSVVGSLSSIQTKKGVGIRKMQRVQNI